MLAGFEDGKVDLAGLFVLDGGGCSHVGAPFEA
jgi:hypothetical protein